MQDVSLDIKESRLSEKTSVVKRSSHNFEVPTKLGTSSFTSISPEQGKTKWRLVLSSVESGVSGRVRACYHYGQMDHQRRKCTNKVSVKNLPSTSRVKIDTSGQDVSIYQQDLI